MHQCSVLRVDCVYVQCEVCNICNVKVCDGSVQCESVQCAVCNVNSVYSVSAQQGP